MTEKEVKKEWTSLLLTKDDICIYCYPNKRGGIYYNKTYNNFYEYEQSSDYEQLASLPDKEAKEKLKAVKRFLSKDAKELLKQLWSDF